jgi:MATE family multidrug resistance protein
VSESTRFDLPAEAELPRALVVLGLPVLAEQLLAFCVGFFDVYLSGRLSSEATAAIGVAAYVSWLASMISGLVGTGAAAIVARTCGGGDIDEARRITARALMLAGLMGVFILGGLQFGAPFFASLLGMRGETRQITIEYLRFDAFGQTFACGTLIAASALRGAGDMRTPLVVLGFTNVVNMLISTGCVYGWGPLPELGVTGIVTGTLIAQASGFALMLVMLRHPSCRLQIRFADVRWHADTVRRILRIGGPAALDGSITFAGHFLFLMVIARLSPEGFDGAVFAAHVVGVRVESLSYLPAVAWGAASASLAGRLLGAHQPELARKVGQIALRQFLWYAITVTFVFFFGAPWIYTAMHSDPAVAAVGVPAFRWLAWYQVPNAILIIYVSTLRGAGDTRFPLVCAIVSILGIRVPVAYLGGIVAQQGLIGAWWGMGLDNLVRAILVIWRLHGDRWLRVKV